VEVKVTQTPVSCHPIKGEKEDTAMGEVGILKGLKEGAAHLLQKGKRAMVEQIKNRTNMRL